MLQPTPMQGQYGTPFTDQSAILWIFSPRNYSNQAKRPFVYAFNGQFIDAAEEAVALKASTNNAAKMDAFVKNPFYMNAMKPPMHADHIVDMQRLSQNWTFMLITNNDKTGPGGVVRAMSDNQHLYYGFFVGEPVNPFHHMGQVTPNPDAELVITHKTQINRHPMVGAYGQMPRLDVTTDQDIIRPQFLAPLTRTPTALMRPADLISSIGTGMGDEVVVMSRESSQMHHLPGPVPITSKLSVPSYNIQKVMQAVSDTQESMQGDAVASNALTLFNRDNFDMLVEQNLQDNAHQHQQGLPMQSVLHLAHVLQRYNPKIQVIRQDTNPRYDPIDQSRGLMRNAFSSMLSTVVPAIMADFMLADITFSYHSPNQAFRLEGDPASLTALPMEDLRVRVQSFLAKLRLEIFPILVNNYGEFNLSMHSTVGGITSINLNFYADDQRTTEIFEVPTILGGMNSTLIGTADIADQNARELGLLMKALGDTDRDSVPRLGHYDNRQFNKGMITYDQSQGGAPIMPAGPQPSDPHDKWKI